MTDLRGWALAEQHLVPDAIVAFVDGELSVTAQARARAHLVRCPLCASEAMSQRQARAAVRAAESPSVPPGLLASLRSIPEDVDLPVLPDELSVSEDGQVVVMLRPAPAKSVGDTTTAFGTGARLGAMARLGSTPLLGSGAAVLGSRARGVGRWARHGAGIVVSGLVLGALVMVSPTSGVQPAERSGPAQPDTGPVVAGATGVNSVERAAPLPVSGAAINSATPRSAVSSTPVPSVDMRYQGVPIPR
jgi:anti-sigma factor RsiW